jgi:heme exporter protein A
VALAKLLCRQSSLWILDEPFTALDSDAVNWLIDVIGQHLANKGMIVMTTHQDTAVSQHITREVVLLVRANT